MQRIYRRTPMASMISINLQKIFSTFTGEHLFIYLFIYNLYFELMLSQYETNLNRQKRKKIDKKNHIQIYIDILQSFLKIYCVIVTTGRISHDSYTMKPRDILSRTHVCQTMCVLRHPKVSWVFSCKFAAYFQNTFS